jgi:hypothetical protein
VEAISLRTQIRIIGMHDLMGIFIFKNGKVKGSS